MSVHAILFSGWNSDQLIFLCNLLNLFIFSSWISYYSCLQVTY
jgi:hypothetical protein